MLGYRLVTDIINQSSSQFLEKGNAKTPTTYQHGRAAFEAPKTYLRFLSINRNTYIINLSN